MTCNQLSRDGHIFLVQSCFWKAAVQSGTRFPSPSLFASNDSIWLVLTEESGCIIAMVRQSRKGVDFPLSPPKALRNERARRWKKPTSLNHLESCPASRGEPWRCSNAPGRLAQGGREYNHWSLAAAGTSGTSEHGWYQHQGWRGQLEPSLLPWKQH